MILRLRKFIKWPVFAILGLALLFLSDDVFKPNVAQEAAAPFIYDLFEWETSNFLSKWIHRLKRIPPFASISGDEKRRQLQEFFELSDEIRGVQNELNQAALNGGNDRAGIPAVQSSLDGLVAERGAIRNDVEETIEGAISAIAGEEGLSVIGEFLFPPVDVRLSQPPKVLITSPRDRIRRTHDVLLKEDIKLREREEIEAELLDGANLSAIVLNIGGLATYPASIPTGQPLRWTIQSSAHEWLHHYFFFRLLGQHMFDSGDMVSLNETIASIVGREMGDRAYELLGGVIPPSPPDSADSAQNETPVNGEARFDFNREMRKTRVRVDELLAEGKIEEAESYMEERRLIFVENGFAIRKLNQAWFAFNGTYADTPASVSPIGSQVQEFRDLHPTLGGFISSVSSLSNYEQFLKELEELKASSIRPAN